MPDTRSFTELKDLTGFVNKMRGHVDRQCLLSQKEIKLIDSVCYCKKKLNLTSYLCESKIEHLSNTTLVLMAVVNPPVAHLSITQP